MDEVKTKDVEKTEKKSNNKPSNSLKNNIGEIRGEFKKITWPTRKELAKKTATVIVTSFIVGIIVVSMDAAFTVGLNSFASLVK